MYTSDSIFPMLQVNYRADMAVIKERMNEGC